MYRDRTLTPKEALRLSALGSLAAGPMSYGDLALSIRHFVSHLLGPTPEIMGHSIELLKYEGLVAGVPDGRDREVLALTDAGREQLHTLLVANLRPGASELNKLVVALKFRFLHLLSPEDRRHQAELLTASCEQELARLESLKEHYQQDPGYLQGWLHHEIAQLRERIHWFEDLRHEMDQDSALASKP